MFQSLCAMKLKGNRTRKKVKATLAFAIGLAVAITILISASKEERVQVHFVRYEEDGCTYFGVTNHTRSIILFSADAEVRTISGWQVSSAVRVSPTAGAIGPGEIERWRVQPCPNDAWRLRISYSYDSKFNEFIQSIQWRLYSWKMYRLAGQLDSDDKKDRSAYGPQMPKATQ